jgi:uncharacterized protein YjbI with pentapeptide repeats
MALGSNLGPMKNILFTLTTLTFTSAHIFAAELEYHYRPVDGTYRCVDRNNHEGLNPSVLDECGQVSGMKFENISVRRKIAGLRSVGTRYIGADFTASYLLDCEFGSSHFENSNFDQIKIRHSKFSGAEFSHQTFKGSLITGSSFSAAKFNATKFSNSLLALVNMSAATLTSVSFESALISQTDFSKANLQQASFRSASLQDINFENANLRGADFTDAYIGGSTNWKGAQYDRTTKLPFSDEKAAEEGMLKF